MLVWEAGKLKTDPEFKPQLVDNAFEDTEAKDYKDHCGNSIVIEDELKKDRIQERQIN